MLSTIRNAVCGLWRPATCSANLAVARCSVSEISKRFESNYNPYQHQQYETDKPYKPRRGIRNFYNLKMHGGGVLPRPEGKFEHIPFDMPRVSLKDRDAWTHKKAVFGQNDYIDILGDGSVHPWELVIAPAWLKGYKGNELQRVSRQLATHGTFLQETFPTKYHSLKKSLFFLYKRLNRRRRTPYWGNSRMKSRIDKPGR